MVVHMLKVRKGPFGDECTLRGSLCGRLNSASTDGMNVSDNPAEVTCKFCKRIEATRTTHPSSQKK
jgi:hypothetical protein